MFGSDIFTVCIRMSSYMGIYYMPEKKSFHKHFDIWLSWLNLKLWLIKITSGARFLFKCSVKKSVVITANVPLRWITHTSYADYQKSILYPLSLSPSLPPARPLLLSPSLCMCVCVFAMNIDYCTVNNLNRKE